MCAIEPGPRAGDGLARFWKSLISPQRAPISEDVPKDIHWSDRGHARGARTGPGEFRGARRFSRAFRRPILILAAMVDEERGEQAEVAARHHYRICEILPRDKKTRGRPRRVDVMAFPDVSEAELVVLRKQLEPNLRERQVAVLDHITVARGSGVTEEEVRDSEPAQDKPAAKAETPAEFLDLAHRFTWDIYQRDAAAAEALREQVHELTQRSLEQNRMMVDLLAELRATMQRPPPPAPPPPPGRQMSLDDISKLIQVGAAAFRDIMRPDRSES
ncbi:MAG: hypothetical protein R3F65_32250 [bacterium]